MNDFQEEEKFNFENDIYEQENPFEYYKLILLSSIGDSKLKKKDKEMILNIYNNQYIPLIKKLDKDELKFLNDILKLVAGLASSPYVIKDNTLPYDYMTKNINTLQPKLRGLPKNKKKLPKNNTKKIKTLPNKDTKKRPRGRAPKGKIWDYQKGMWVNLN